MKIVKWALVIFFVVVFGVIYYIYKTKPGPEIIVNNPTSEALHADSEKTFCESYDLKAEDTVKGEVVSIKQDIPGMPNLLHVVLKTNSGDVAMLLGPIWYVEKQKVKVRVKEAVEVNGCRMQLQGKYYFYAKTVKIGNEILRLRNENGTALWKKPGKEPA